MHRARFFTWAVTTLLLSCAALPPAAATASSAGDYTEQYGRSMLTSDQSWRHGRIVSPYYFCLDASLDAGGSELANCHLRAQTLWVPSCPRRAQTVTFTHNVSAYGPPAQASFYWAGPFTPNRYLPWVSDITLEVNGVPALHLTPGAVGPYVHWVALTPSQTTPFEVGQNVIGVRVTKSANPSRRWDCKQMRPKFGIAFALAWTVGAHVSESFPAPGADKDRYVRSRSLTLSGTVTVHNDGPSAALGTTLTFDTRLDAGMVDQPPQLSPSQGSCTRRDVAAGHYQFACTFGTLNPGASASLTVTESLAASPGNEQTVMGTYAWTAGNSDTIDGEVSGVGFIWSIVYLCGQESTEQGCASAPEAAWAAL